MGLKNTFAGTIHTRTFFNTIGTPNLPAPRVKVIEREGIAGSAVKSIGSRSKPRQILVQDIAVSVGNLVYIQAIYADLQGGVLVDYYDAYGRYFLGCVVLDYEISRIDKHKYAHLEGRDLSGGAWWIESTWTLMIPWPQFTSYT